MISPHVEFVNLADCTKVMLTNFFPVELSLFTKLSTENLQEAHESNPCLLTLSSFMSGDRHCYSETGGQEPLSDRTALRSLH